jgi:putative DNA-invertase from lambdoid prophage Rac
VRAGVYLRCSTSEQSTELQRKEIESYVQTHGWSFTIFEDHGVSGTHERRPQLQALLKNARARKLDVVVVYKLDRFFRSLKHLVVTLQELDDLGVAFISVKDSIDLSTASGRLMMHLIGAFSQFEAEIIRERVMAGLAHARARGQKLGRPKCSDPIQIQLLRAQGFSYRKIAEALGVSVATVQRGLEANK